MGCGMSDHLWVPRYAFLSKGKGIAVHPIAAFDAALRAAGVSALNLVSVSSVFPPECRLIDREEGTGMLRPGQVAFCVMARHESNQLGRSIAAAIGLTVPADPTQYGYLAELHSDSRDESAAASQAEALAHTLLAAKQGVAPETLRLSQQLSIAQTARVEHENQWACAVALCVFIL